MFLKFAHKEINEFAQGVKIFENTGEPFEVAEALGNQLLKATGKLRGEKVSIFTRHDKKVSQSALPEEFPMRDELEENGIFTMEQVKELKLDDHKNLKGIGATTMQRIIDAITEGEQ